MRSAVRAHDIRPTLHLSRPGSVIEVQPIHVLEVELQRALRAVDLESVAVLVAGGLPGRLETRHRPAREPRQEQHRVIHGDLALARAPLDSRRDATGRCTGHQRPLLDERLGNRADNLRDLLARHEPRHVHDVGV